VARILSMNETTDVEAVRQQGRGAKLRALADLPDLLENIETNITERGGHVLWAVDAAEANRHVLDICRKHDLKFGVKTKSMVTEELELVPVLRRHGIDMLETDLGEFVVQVDESHPSHIVTPIMHMTKEKVHDLFVEKLGMEPMGEPVDPTTMTDLVARNVAIKARVVEEDEKESGVRAHLNFGHTFAHAIEATSGYGRIEHGEAVSLGMVAATRLGADTGLCEAALADQLVELLDAIGLPTQAELADVDELMAAMKLDKKVKNDRIRLVLPERMGAVRIVDDCPAEAIAKAWATIRK